MNRRDIAPQSWAKIDFFHVFFMKNNQKCQLVSQNRALATWGGAAQLWVGKKLFSTNQFRFTQTEISDRAHPLASKNDASKMSVLALFFEKNSIISNCCRNLCQKFLPKFLGK